MPMLELPDVPALYAGRQLRWLLHKSDGIFPRINAIGTVSNLVLTVMCFLKRNESQIAGVKWPVLAGAFLSNVGATLWTFAFMIPRNSGMRKFSQKVEENRDDKVAEKELRRLQAEWRAYAYGRFHWVARLGLQPCLRDTVLGYLSMCDVWLTSRDRSCCDHVVVLRVWSLLGLA